MSVNAISSTPASAVATAASTYVKQVTGGGSNLSSSLQELSETPATTAREAAKGDPVAKRLLVRQQQKQQLQDPTPTPEPGKGEVIDEKA